LNIYRDTGNRFGESQVLHSLALASVKQQAYDSGRALLEQATKISYEINDRRVQAGGIGNLGYAYMKQHHYGDSLSHLQQSLALFRQLGDRQGEIWILGYLSIVWEYLGEFEKATAYREETLQYARKIGNRQVECASLLYLSRILCHICQFEQARERCQSALKIAQEIEDGYHQGLAHVYLAHVLGELGVFQEAIDHYNRAQTFQQIYYPQGTAESLAGLAYILFAQQKLNEAKVIVDEILNDFTTNKLNLHDAALFIYFQCYRILNACKDSRAENILRDAYDLIHMRAETMPKGQFRNAYLHKLTLHKKIRKEYKGKKSLAQLPNSSSLNPIEPLTKRELEILRLVAAGHTNQQIAAKLVVSINTVKRHLTNLYGKLNVANRSQAVAQARKLDLI
jgi:ATP/maltotriose-dependent transcriptional regulator MalT